MCLPLHVFTQTAYSVLMVDVIVLSYVIFCFFFGGGDVYVYLGAYFCVHECVRCRSGRVCPLFIDCKEVLSVSVRAAE